MVYEDPDELGYFAFPVQRDTPAELRMPLPGATKREWGWMESAALAEKRGDVILAEEHRVRAGYGGLD